ncbi:MAG: hypothetical protein ACE5G0_04820 [Rhodothermales bacterium]
MRRKLRRLEGDSDWDIDGQPLVGDRREEAGGEVTVGPSPEFPDAIYGKALLLIGSGILAGR